MDLTKLRRYMETLKEKIKTNNLASLEILTIIDAGK